MFDLIQKYYKGFFIDQPVGNNAFSYQDRKTKEIYVPPIKRGTIQDLKTGENAAFCEVFDHQEISCRGLESFFYFKKDGKDIFIFDNHNHAFFFWIVAWKQRKINEGMTLLHVDQHKDMRQPEENLTDSLDEIDIQKVFDYTNFKLNIGNFIYPALKLGVFPEIVMMNSESSLQRSLPERFVLDLDMDIFAKEMGYIKEEIKIKAIRSAVHKAQLITIATSPYFIDQTEAISMINKIFAGE